MRLVLRRPVRLGVLVLALFCGSAVAAQADDAPAHGRPFFMPEWKRQEIRELVAGHDWAARNYREIKAQAEKGNGYWAAFMYALEGDAQYVEPARDWLLNRAEGWIKGRPGQSLRDPEFFVGGQPWLSDVYYDLEFSAYVAFDWVHKGLDESSRRRIHEGIWTHAEFKKRAMTRWSHTANLMFKPTFMVAMAGMTLQDPELLAWGFRREPGGKWRVMSAARGGYFPAMNEMCRGGGPWFEAPIYPIAHEVLWCMAQMSFYRKLYDGKDWFRERTPSRASPEGLMDYFLHTTYPAEALPDGRTFFRIGNYGDGSTSPGGHDLFLVHPEERQVTVHKALAAAYNASGKAMYAPFVARIPGYQPNIWDRRPLPENIEFPPAPSNVWDYYGLAMLRSNESPGYWTDRRAITALQMLAQGYGHDHRDKFGLILHGAGTLLYPDYNAIQYENPAIGWTRNSVAHNLVVVDQQDTRDDPNPDVRWEFTPEVKFLATTASGVFQGVDMTRVLMLTDSYLLDVFRTSSRVPRTYDYLLHSFGQPRPADPGGFQTAAGPPRYTALAEERAKQTDGAWSLDFVVRRENKDTAAVRVRMDGEPGTTVWQGVWGGRFGEIFQQQFPDRELDRLGMMVVRRADRRGTLFVATHEPYYPGEPVKIGAVETLARTSDAVLVRVRADGYTDFAAAAFGPQDEGRTHVLAGEGGIQVAFRNYAFARVAQGGGATARGGLVGFALPGQGRLVLNGQPAPARQEGELLVGGEQPETPPVVAVAPEPPFQVAITPEVVRLAAGGRREVQFALRNISGAPVSGRLAFDLPEGVTTEPEQPAFETIAPGRTATVEVTFAAAAGAPAGARTAPYRFILDGPDDAETETLELAAKIAVGPVLAFDYSVRERPCYQIDAPRFTARLDMSHAMPRQLADDEGNVRIDDSPLFTFDGEGKPMLFEHTPQAFTWPNEVPASMLAHAFDRCRWRIHFGGDRMTMSMDPDWTRFERAEFTVPGRWVSPQGAPSWGRIVALDDAGREIEVRPRANLKNVVAAELEFPGGPWNVAFAFQPAQEVTFDGASLRFSIGSFTGDRWSVGFCRPGELDSWRPR